MAEPKATEAFQTAKAPEPSADTIIRAASAPTDRDLARDRTVMYEDLPAEAKLERLRDVVRHLDQENGELRTMVYELLRHQHGADGRLVVPMGIGQPMGIERHRPEPAKRWL